MVTIAWIILILAGIEVVGIPFVVGKKYVRTPAYSAIQLILNLMIAALAVNIIWGAK